MMSFQDFLEHSEALFRREIPGAGTLPFSDTHIFNLGTDEKVEDGIKDIWEDLKAEMTDRIPLPFPDTTCMSMVKNSMVEGQPPGWILDRIVEMPALPHEIEKLKKCLMPGDASPAQIEAAKKLKQKLVVIRFEEGSDVVVSWNIFWYGVVEGQMVLTTAPTAQFLEQLGGRSSPPIDNFLNKESMIVIKQVTAISHPGNYVVQVIPDLTPKEERKTAQGKERPIRKRPHFIVVDHEVLTGMSRKEGDGTHASPVPHERRGHWRRLADRCRQARMLGREKVWVRPSYVGELEFSDGKNHYEVLMDFGKKGEELLVR
jgi:hypothetical protein